MTDSTNTPPDRLSTDPRSDHYDADALQRGVGIRFKGVEKTNIEEYCVSESWVKMAVGKSRDRFGNPMTMKMSGAVEPYYRDIAGDGETTAAAESDAPKTDDAEQAD
ncbi:DUF3297 family protein [Sphingomonas sp. AP4-R1]|uniref:DUF3297 family protein n=1 Tax=Sphingomonas sp. AP4-R1 TaxID=2735134 RepID=UPI0014935412|nr:DUF3297 family protein [Sphingomonas sp. AP4-R1]QJU56622.1 DUF3297 family protein [Sphingomonas sp. AP4-R1]